MKQELDNLLNDVEEYFAKEDGQHPRRYKRLDPRSLLTRAYHLIQDQDEKIYTHRGAKYVCAVCDNDDD